MKKSLDHLLNELSFNTQLFRDFYEISKPKVETTIKKQFNTCSRYKENINLILNDFSWQEWLKKLDSFIEPLSILLITLIYDKILISVVKLQNSVYLKEFLDTLNSKILAEKAKTGVISNKRYGFFHLFEDIWKKAIKLSPSTPILHPDNFSFNKLLNPIFNNWYLCLILNDLVLNILDQKNSKLRLLLPYIFEFLIPENHKQSQGQIFTPNDVVRYISSKNITEETSCIIDPACGTGIFLLGALDFLVKTRLSYQNFDLIGIEKDKSLVFIAESALNYFLLTHISLSINCQIIKEDFFNFDIKGIENFKKNSGKTTILMNPPYTRHELLDPYYKEFIRKKMEKNLKRIQNYDKFSKNMLSGRSGLYVYFLVYSTCLLEEGDNFGLIIPNSWMDTDYGAYLQHFLLDHYNINSLIISRLKKFIPNVEVNTAILNLQKKRMQKSDRFDNVYNEIQLISIDTPESLVLLGSIDNLGTLLDSSKIKIISMECRELYHNHKWSLFFKASRYYLQFLKENKNSLIELKDIVNIRRGFTSGANDFFYLGKPRHSNKYFQSEWDPITGNLLLKIKNEIVLYQFKEQGFEIEDPMFVIEKEYWMHQINSSLKDLYSDILYLDQNGEIWVPNYLIKSPKELSTFEIHEKDANFVVILIPCGSHKTRLQDGLKKYIYWGEKWRPKGGSKFCERPTCYSRKYWYKLSYKDFGSYEFLSLMTVNDRYPFFLNPRDFFFDARLYGIKLKKGEQSLFKFYFLFLNSILTSFQLEMLGRSNLGEGGLDIKVYEYELVKVPKKEIFLNFKSCNIDKNYEKVLQFTPLSILHNGPYEVKHLIDNFIKDFFGLPLESINNLFIDLRNIVRMRIEKASRS